MSEATVFVDDAVTGHLPMVCVRTGAPADGLHRISQRYGGLSGWAALLIFLGPVGWIVLAVLAATSRTRDLTVRLPYSRAGLEREASDFRTALVAGAVMVAAGAVTLLLVVNNRDGWSAVAQAIALLAAGTALVAAVATVAFAARYSGRRPGIDLDASGRWVTLRGVDRAFAAAVRDEQVARRTTSS